MRIRRASHHELVAGNLLVAEFASLREEIFRAYAYAQSIVQFSLAAYGVIFGAGLVTAKYANNEGSLHNFAAYATLIVFGLALPGLMGVTSWTWLGELTRAERAGAYLYAIETRIRAHRGLVGTFGFPPLSWETFLREERESGGLMGKTALPYLGTAALFGGGTLLSVIIAVLWDFQVWRSGERLDFWPIFWFVAPIAIGLLLFITSGRAGRRLLILGKSTARLPD